MSSPPGNRAFATCLFISDQYDDVELVEVETIRPLASVAGIDSLDVGYWVDTEESDTDVYDGTDHRLTFELKMDDIDDAPSRINIARFNMLGVAFRSHQTGTRYTRCDHSATSLTLDSDIFSPRLSPELYSLFISFSSVSSLVVMSNFNRLLFNIIANMYRINIRKRLDVFIPSDVIECVFEVIRECRAILYGSVPFQILLRRFWREDTLKVAVPMDGFDRIVTEFIKLGYNSAEFREPLQDDSRAIVMTHGQTMDKTALLNAALRRSTDIVCDIPKSNLLGYADAGTHYIRGRQYGNETCMYTTPTGKAWVTYFVGKIMSASHGTCHSATGSCQVIPVERYEEVHDVLVLGRPGPVMQGLDDIYKQQNVKLTRRTSKYHNTRTMAGDWSADGKLEFLAAYVSSYAKTQPRTPERQEFWNRVTGDWQERWTLDSHQRQMLHTYFNNKTRNRKHLDRPRRGKKSTDSSINDSPSKGVNRVDTLGEQEVEVDELSEDREITATNIAPSSNEGGRSECQAGIVDSPHASSIEGARQGIDYKNWKPVEYEQPMMHRYDRAEDTILDTELPGCSAADVNLSLKDGCLFLHAIKRATDTEPARRYSGVHRVREGMQLTSCDIEDGVMCMLFTPSVTSNPRPAIGEGQITVQNPISEEQAGNLKR
ncbi:hypothetical protein EYR36_011467 [Pleurotus pulmonarius]|nr:hypothetical protein EYR36_011467 [Pleurotus pulmonarius]